MQQVNVMAGLSIEYAAVEFARAMPVDGEIVVISVPQHIADKLVKFSEPAAVDQLFQQDNQWIVTILVDRQQPFPGPVDPAEQVVRLPHRQ